MDVRLMYSLAILLLISYFPVYSLLDITSRVFDSNINGVIAAFGDFNSDKLTDMFFITEQGRSIEVFLASDKEPIFQKSTSIRCQFNDVLITSVMPGDFNGDSKMDVLLTLKSHHDPQNHTVVAAVLWGNLNILDCSLLENVTMNVQPLLLDYDADMIPELYGESIDGKRYVWIMKSNMTQNISIDAERRIRPIHSNSFVNLNSDMAADIFVTTVKNEFEVWFNKDGEFKKPEIGKFDMADANSVVGQSTFLDIDLDGHLDHIVPVCSTPNCSNSSIYVFYRNTWVPVAQPFSTDDGMWRFFYSDDYPINLRIGDFNLDGYPDILTVLTLNETTREAVLLENKPCPGCRYPRRFLLAREFKDKKSVILAAFYDIYQDGNLDFMIVSQKSKDSKFEVSAVQNDINNDVCFIKVLVLSGLCYRDCPGLNTKPYGVNQPGPFIKYKTTRPDGGAQTSCAAQLAQSAHFSLQLPYTVFGLGQTPNFVDDLDVGIPRSTQLNVDNSHSWKSIIPNSQMIVIPLRKSNGLITWINNLFVTPSHQVLLTLIALSGTCVIIILIIGGLHWKEKIADKKEKLQEAHRFHFDAM